MVISLHEVVGIFGSAIIITTYFLLQTRRMNVQQVQYSILNALGAGFILYSLSVEFNLSAFIIEYFWLVISGIGIVKSYKKKQNESRNS